LDACSLRSTTVLSEGLNLYRRKVATPNEMRLERPVRVLTHAGRDAKARSS